MASKAPPQVFFKCCRWLDLISPPDICLRGTVERFKLNSYCLQDVGWNKYLSNAFESLNLSPEASEKCLSSTMLLANEVHQIPSHSISLIFITGFLPRCYPTHPPVQSSMAPSGVLNSAKPKPRLMPSFWMDKRQETMPSISPKSSFTSPWKVSKKMTIDGFYGLIRWEIQTSWFSVGFVGCRKCTRLYLLIPYLFESCDIFSDMFVLLISSS